MTDKPEYVDMISEATRQNRRRAMRVDVEPIPAKERSRMGHRPPRLEKWREETLTPWKIRSKPWNFVDWG